MIFDLTDPSNMLLEEVLGHAPLEKSETLQDIIFSILGHAYIWVTSFSQTLMLGSVQKYLFSVCDCNSLSSRGLLASSDNLDTKYYMLLESFGW